MKARTKTIIFVTLILTLMWCSAAWADRSNIRDHRQAHRIRQGIRSGEITRPEARGLKNEQLRINRAYHRAVADGLLNWRERVQLKKMQDRASRHIYRAKHNPVRRRLHRHSHQGAHGAFCHRHAVVHENIVNYYYPAMETDYADGYEFSVGVSDTGWQFGFSGFNSR